MHASIKEDVREAAERTQAEARLRQEKVRSDPIASLLARDDRSVPWPCDGVCGVVEPAFGSPPPARRAASARSVTLGDDLAELNELVRRVALRSNTPVLLAAVGECGAEHRGTHAHALSPQRSRSVT